MELVIVGELVGNAADVAAGGEYVEAVGPVKRDGRVERRVADVEVGVWHGSKADERVGGDGVGVGGAVADVVNHQTIIAAIHKGRGRQRDGDSIGGQRSGGDRQAVGEDVIRGVGGAGHFDRLGEHDYEIGWAEAGGALNRGGNDVWEDGQCDWRAGHRAGGVGDDARIDLAVVGGNRDVGEREGRVGGTGAGKVAPIEAPTVGKSGAVGAQDKETRVLPLDEGEAFGLEVDAGFRDGAVVGDHPCAGGARGGHRLFEDAVGQLPAHRQVVSAAALLHQGLDVIAVAGLEVNRGALLGSFRGPDLGVGPTAHISYQRLMRWCFVGAEEQIGVVVARNPEDIVPAGRGNDERPQLLAIVVLARVNLGFKGCEDLGVIRIGIVGPVGVVGGVG